MAGYEKILAGVVLLGAMGACTGEGAEDRAEPWRIYKGVIREWR